jgi:hypothetical protein
MQQTVADSVGMRRLLSGVAKLRSRRAGSRGAIAQIGRRGLDKGETMRLCQIVAVVCVLAATGCSSLLPIKPDVPQFQEPLVEQLSAHYADPKNVAPEKITTKTERNRVLDDLIFLVDVNYSAFEQDIYAKRAGWSTASDLLVLGLNGTGALMTPVNTVRILSGISAAVTGARASVELNYLQDKSTQALIASMQAGRRTRLVELRKGMTNSLEDYTLGHGLSDLAEYYNAGTLVGALNGIVEDAGDEKKKADEDLAEIVDVQFATTNRPLRNRIGKWLETPANSVELHRWLNDEMKLTDAEPAAWVEEASKEQLEAAITEFKIP